MANKAAPAPSAHTTQPPLPAERAFVVQLRAQGDPGEHLFVGRAEHIASGTAARFASADELIAFIASVLAPAGAPPAAPLTANERT